MEEMIMEEMVEHIGTIGRALTVISMVLVSISPFVIVALMKYIFKD